MSKQLKKAEKSGKRMKESDYLDVFENICSIKSWDGWEFCFVFKFQFFLSDKEKRSQPNDILSKLVWTLSFNHNNNNIIHYQVMVWKPWTESIEFLEKDWKPTNSQGWCMVVANGRTGNFKITFYKKNVKSETLFLAIY